MIKLLLILILININFDTQAKIETTLLNLYNNFNNVRDFTKFKKEAYFSAQSTLGDISVIVKVIKINGQWSNPTIASFSGSHHDMEPFITTDGLKLYFASKRPTSIDDTTKDVDIWFVKRDSIDGDWSNPINLGAPINTDKNEFYPSLADNNNLYFTANYSDSKGKDDIYVSQFKDGNYQKPYSLSAMINTEGEEYNAFIAPDESYLIFGAYKRADGFGSGDLYISHKDNAGKWSQAKNMGEPINSKSMEYCPFVDMNTYQLYFTGRRNNQDTHQFKNIKNLLETFNSYENGMSRIYSTTFKTISNSLNNL